MCEYFHHFIKSYGCVMFYIRIASLWKKKKKFERKIILNCIQNISFEKNKTVWNLVLLVVHDYAEDRWVFASNHTHQKFNIIFRYYIRVKREFTLEL